MSPVDQYDFLLASLLGKIMTRWRRNVATMRRQMDSEVNELGCFRLSLRGLQPWRPPMNDAASSSSDPGRSRRAGTKASSEALATIAGGPRWSIRARLATGAARPRLALFNLAIDSKLRGCDLVALLVDDVASNGYAIDRANSPSEEDRPPRSLRADGSEPSGTGRLPSHQRPKAWSMLVPRPSRPRQASDDAPVRASC